MWCSRKVGVVGGFVVSTGFSESGVWIRFNLSISTWIWFLISVIQVLIIIRIFLIFSVKWFLKLLDSIVLLINFLWNKTSWSIWVNLSFYKRLRSSTLSFTSSIISISLPSIRDFSHDSSSIEVG